MKKYSCLGWIFWGVVFQVSAQTSTPPAQKVKHCYITNLELPKVKTGEQIIHHVGYSLSYNEAHEQATWVAYQLTAEETKKRVGRSNRFMEDPLVKTGSAVDIDYKGSGYDRGHLAPAADMGWSMVSMEESFYYSNMSPQLPGFNRGIWKNLEELVRHWALDYDSLEIVTGPVLRKGLNTIGPNAVSVPEYYYKVILDYCGEEVKAIGFLLPNAASRESLQFFALTVDSLERLTGLDFFPLLPDEDEKALEKSVCLTCWNWGGTGGLHSKEQHPATQAADSRQCSGITNAGKRCQNETSMTAEFCIVHQKRESENHQPKSERREVSVQCSGTTRAGDRCKRKTLSKNGRCYQHGAD
jgi:endonuclease G